MKKVLILISILFLITGCTNLNKSNLDSLIKDTTHNIMTANEYRTGYKYYLPSNLNIIKSDGFNEVFSEENNKYYLYVDLIGFYNNTSYTYTKSSNAYYSTPINNGKNKGYLEIFVKNDKYLIEIIYNYAKIEVIVDKDNINEAVVNSLIILSSINYNKDIIENMIGEDILNYSEEKFSIFDTNTKDSNFLEYVQEYDNYDSKKSNEIPDYDLIN